LQKTKSNRFLGRARKRKKLPSLAIQKTVDKARGLAGGGGDGFMKQEWESEAKLTDPTILYPEKHIRLVRIVAKKQQLSVAQFGMS